MEATWKPVTLKYVLSFLYYAQYATYSCNICLHLLFLLYRYTRVHARRRKMRVHYLIWIWIHFSFGESEFHYPCQEICLCKEGAKFVNCSGVNLQVLLLSGNYITEVGERAFSSLERLQKLDIHRNEITVLGSSFSTGLTRLRQLHLQNNHLLNLHNGVFSMLQHLEFLNLEGNRIKTIAPGVFTSLNSLTVLNLVHNEIEHIRFKTFLTIQTPGTHILLSYNPWICDCDLQRVFAKLHSVKRLILDDYDNMTCMEPQVLRNLSLSSVDTQLCVAETVTVLVITFTVFITVVAAIVMAERNRKKRTGKHWRKKFLSQPNGPESHFYFLDCKGFLFLDKFA
uniref:LRRCT domain-containing protein n=1 Tax=Terrapene triunguis TaxID=2587831 RepID=A0A674IRS7_9SAUR